MKAKTAKLFALMLPLAVANVALADEAAMQAAGAEIFKKCAACHSVDTSKNAFGPSLVGVVGREAGSLPRFAYSDALKNSKIVWNEDNLRKWMAGNDQFVPGTRMRHIEITDVAEQDYLLAYLKSLK